MVTAQNLHASAQFFQAISDEERLALVILLSEGEYTVSQLCEKTGTMMSNMSARLKILYTGGLISKRREGKNIFYTLADAHVLTIIKNVTDHVAHCHN